MNLKEFLKPTMWKIVLFAVMFFVYIIFYLFPIYLNYIIESTALTAFHSDQKNLGVFIATPTALQAPLLISEIAAIYLLSCIIITIKNKIKKK